jgi:hypothetical protein
LVVLQDNSFGGGEKEVKAAARGRKRLGFDPEREGRDLWRGKGEKQVVVGVAMRGFTPLA